MMRFESLRRCRELLLLALLLPPCGGVAAESRSENRKAPAAAAPANLQAVTAEYRRKLEEYTRVRKRFDDDANAYWNAVAEKRRARNSKRRNNQEIVLDDYVLAQPPVYSGPPKPVDPTAPIERPPPPPKIPVVADFLRAAAEQFRFSPQRPQSEIEYKRIYAKVASAAGLTREQIVRIYAFEAGGNGRYDVQAGLENPKPGARAISTALGYNQLLATNSVELMAEKGDQFIKTLKAKAANLFGEARKALEGKIAVVQRMVHFSRSVPNSWSEHEKLADTPQGLGIHAMNLDVDVGPFLQTQKLLDSIAFARSKGHGAPLSAAELELMNLTGDGNGLDMVMMPPAMRERVPTANFFLKPGYERNPVAIRNNVVAKLLAEINARMDAGTKLQGAKDLAAGF